MRLCQSISLVILFLSTACATQPVKSAEMPVKISDSLLARVNVAFSALDDAFKEWGLHSGQDCVLLFTDKEQWLLGCPEMSGKEFKTTGQTWRSNPILWHEKSLYLTGNYIPYETVKQSLVGTVGNYSSGTGELKPVLIIQDWNALHGNHPGFIDSNMEEWIGLFVHEAFHSRQMWHPRVQSILNSWSKKPVATAEDLATFYRSNDEYKAAIAAEHQLLKSAIEQNIQEPAKVRAVLIEWLKLYKQRYNKFSPLMEKVQPGKQMWQIDQFLTFLEGTARYVEAKFLISPTGNIEELEGDPSFKNFVSSKNKKPSGLVGLSGVGPKYFYSIGMYLAFLLDRVEPTWKLTVFDHDGLLIQQVQISSKKNH